MIFVERPGNSLHWDYRYHGTLKQEKGKIPNLCYVYPSFNYYLTSGIYRKELIELKLADHRIIEGFSNSSYAIPMLSNRDQLNPYDVMDSVRSFISWAKKHESNFIFVILDPFQEPMAAHLDSDLKEQIIYELSQLSGDSKYVFSEGMEQYQFN